MTNRYLLQTVATHAPVKDQQEQLPALQILVDAPIMVSLYLLANKFLPLMDATHALVRHLALLLAHQDHVDVLTTEQP